MLQFLGSLDQGRGINVLIDAIQPTIDVTSFVGANARRFSSGTVASPGAGSFQVSGPSVSPATQNQTWRVLAFSANVVTDATGTVTGAHLEYSRLGAADPMPISDSITLGVNSRGVLIADLYTPLILLPGDMLNLRGNAATATHTWTWGVLYEILSPAS